MDIKKAIKQILPPILLDLYRSCKATVGRSGSRYVWEGIYQHYRDVPTIGQGYRGSGDGWLNGASSSLQEIVATYKNYGTIPTRVFGIRVLLPILASLMYQQNGSKIRILDFGGGVGKDYLHLLSSISKDASIDYHIVELDWACRVGSRFFEHDDRIHFYTSLPDDLSDIDIIYMNAALQYVEDYASFLKRLCAYKAKYLLFLRVSAGDFPTYATAQKNIPGTTMAYWFININEILEIMTQGSYSLIFKGAHEAVHRQDNFPKEYRLDDGRDCMLLFARS